MLSTEMVCATLAVKDLNVAKNFYSNVLGLTQVSEIPGVITYDSGGSKLFVYQSNTAGTNQATSAQWIVGSIEKIVGELEDKGIVFEHYEMPEAIWKGNIMIMNNMNAAWFKDPDGNILSVVSSSE